MSGKEFSGRRHSLPNISKSQAGVPPAPKALPAKLLEPQESPRHEISKLQFPDPVLPYTSSWMYLTEPGYELPRKSEVVLCEICRCSHPVPITYPKSVTTKPSACVVCGITVDGEASRSVSESKEAPAPKDVSPPSPSTSAPLLQQAVPFALQVEAIERVQRDWEECGEVMKNVFSIYVGVVE